MQKSAGILLAISSLPSEYGIGCFDESTYEFADFLESAGQRYWQLLPMCPTGFGDSPYQSFSVFAGNSYFISLKALCDEGLLTKKECDLADFGKDICNIDYQKLYENRRKLLKTAYCGAKDFKDRSFDEFCRNNAWLDDYALFMALKDKFGGASHDKWGECSKLSKSDLLQKYGEELFEQTSFYKFLQYKFFEQWAKLKEYANKKRILIIGDMPIYASYDSADVWACPALFDLDFSKKPRYVAGCPPDGFAENGQLWGNPLYNWKEHEKSGYQWWIKRFEKNFELYDTVRIDHFRGFDEYYAIDANLPLAKFGIWKKGPGAKLFEHIEKSLGKKDIIAEDLGFVTDTVKQLVKRLGFAGMKVLQFAFDSRDTGHSGDYLPCNYSENCVAYTGTHDNHTLVSWLKSISDEEKKNVKEYFNAKSLSDSEICTAMIAAVLQSRANRCIIPMQDWLGLDDSARMNTPSTVGKNWRWRMKRQDINEKLCEKIRRMTENCGR